MWFLLCTTIALLFLARSVANLFRDRFPHPADIATISIVYYGVPLAVAGYYDINYDHMVFLANFAADRGLALMSMQFIITSLVALEAGRRLGMRFGPPRLTRFAQASVPTMERTRFAFLGLIALIGIGIYFFGLSEFLSGYATEGLDATGSTGNAVVYATLEFMGLTIAFAMVLGKLNGRIPFKILILSCIVIMIIILAVRAKRLEIVSAFIPPAIVLLSNRSTISTSSWRLILGGAAIFVLVCVSALRMDGTNFSVGQGVFLFFSEGLYAGHSLPGITERLDTQLLNYEVGARFVNALAGFVPRFVWEGKDEMVYAGNLALKGVAPLGATSFLAEVVLQGGLIAIVMVYSVMGFVFERIARFRDGWDVSMAAGVIPARFGAYLIAIAIFIPHFRDGIIPAVKLALQAGMFFALLSGMRLISQPKIVIHAASAKTDQPAYQALPEASS